MFETVIWIIGLTVIFFAFAAYLMNVRKRLRNDEPNIICGSDIKIRRSVSLKTVTPTNVSPAVENSVRELIKAQDRHMRDQVADLLIYGKELKGDSDAQPEPLTYEKLRENIENMKQNCDEIPIDELANDIVSGEWWTHKINGDEVMISTISSTDNFVQLIDKEGRTFPRKIRAFLELYKPSEREHEPNPAFESDKYCRACGAAYKAQQSCVMCVLQK